MAAPEIELGESRVVSGDARALPRLPVRLAVSAHGLSAPLGVTRDISLQGLYLETSQPFDVGTVVPLSLDLEGDGKPIRLRAEVMRRTPEGMGLRFHTDDGAAIRKLRRWVTDRTSVRGTQKQVEQLLATSATVEPIRAAGRIRQMLEDIHESRAVVTIVPPVRVSRDKAVLRRVEAEALEWASEERSMLQVGEEVYAVVGRQFVSWSFGVRVLEVTGGRVRTTLPEMIVYSERRTRDRVPLPAGSVVRWPAPWQAGAHLEQPVLERSAEGLSFRVLAEGCLLAPGTPLEEAVLVSEGVTTPLPSAVIKHITPEGGADGTAWLRVGVSFGVPRAPRGGATSAPPPPSSDTRRRRGLAGKFQSYVERAWNAVGYLVQKGRVRLDPQADTAVSRRVRIKGRPHELAALLDATELGPKRLKAPLVIVVPGFAGRKEQMSFLAGTIVDGFRRQGGDVAVLRFDGSNNLGESGRDPECQADGLHALHYTVSANVSDIEAVLAWARDNPLVEPTHLVLVSVSMSSIAVRHVLTRAEAADVGLWVSYMGAADAIDAVRNVSGNIDLHAYWTLGQKLGIVSLSGVLGDGDLFWNDLSQLGIADLEAARREMARIRADVLWIQGRHDAWMDPRRVQQLIDTPAPGHRELVVVESGHMPQRGDVAIAQFVRITQLLWRHVHKDHLDTFAPNLGRLAAVAEAEWAAVRGGLKDRQTWWRDYLIDPEGMGFDVLTLDPHYARLMDLQAELLEPGGADVLDLGAGTGNLSTRLLARGARKVVAADLVPEALDAIVAKLGDDARLSVQVVDLDGTPRCAVRRWIAGDLPSARLLAERVPGVHRASLERLLELPDERIHAALRGCEVDLEAIVVDHRLAPPVVHLLTDLQALARLERGRVPLDAVRSGLQVLPASLLDGAPGLPFPDASFDAIGLSLVVSYLDHPEDLLFECWRVLRPGGRLLVSSLVTDSESSKFYLELIHRFETMPEADVPAGRTRQDLLDSVRHFADHAAELVRLEEEGLFRFYDAERLTDLVARRGFVDARVDRAWGQPPQAAIVTCRKP